jgi:D-alanyl-D-alanine carboxypeptidase
VSDLDKLSKTDKELLQKYSKVYFLNEHYVPESLKEIDDEWKYGEDKEHKLHSKVMPFFEDMLEDAKDDEIELWVVSAYRSFEYQSQLKGAYTVTYGAGANAFSADQGFSEHQLGTTMDLTTKGLNGGLDGFANTEAYKWLVENAHKYGFTLSYPEGNDYYVFEPWHWRFVGQELATYLKKNDLHFYDVAQREIDQYLLHIFD